jgi:CDP-glucose 4,6-dehydratase
MLVRGSSWQGRRVLVTGHTGFKGGWLALWLRDLGAEVTGFAPPPVGEPSFFEQTCLRALVRHIEGDVRDLGAVEAAVREARPEVVFHLAAQPLVRLSYERPVETYATNVMGTAHVLEACRRVEGVRAAVCVTSDKCYENREWVWPYREGDPMGGHDPYSSSKGAAELVVSAYRRSFFETGTRIASVRAGNVIGGGDWASDRLIPDLVRAWSAGTTPELRQPDAVRPWQHVLEPLNGYLVYLEEVVTGRDIPRALNFGPSSLQSVPVREVAAHAATVWRRTLGNETAARYSISTDSLMNETHFLEIDSSLATDSLGWCSVLDWRTAVELTVRWYVAQGAGASARQLVKDQLLDFVGAVTQ